MGGTASLVLPMRWRLESGVINLAPLVSMPAGLFGVLSSLALAALASSACRRGQEGMVPVPHSNLQRVLMQLSGSSNASRILSVAISASLSLDSSNAFLV